MYVEIYADIVFLINFIMDLFVFWAAGKLAGKKTRFRRLLLGAAISAALYCLLIFLPYTDGLIFRFADCSLMLPGKMNIFFAMVVLMLGIAAAFRLEGVKDFLKLVLLALIATFVTGGAAMALFFYTDITGYISNFSFKLLLAATIGSYLSIKLFSAVISKMIIHKQVFCPVKIFLGSDNASLNVLVDTGNSLHDPLTNSPVLIAEFDEVKNILPDGLKLIFYEHMEEDLAKVMLNIAGTVLASRIRMIPFCSLGERNGMLIGFKPDKVVITNKNEFETDDVIVGIYNSTLSKDGAYRGLLNPALLK